MRTALQEVLEAEMTEALGAQKSERTAGRIGYRSGYYGRTLITRIGKLELRVPQNGAATPVKAPAPSGPAAFPRRDAPVAAASCALVAV